MAHAPSTHLEATRLVEIDGIGSDQGRSVVVDNVVFVGGDDPKLCAERKTRPIGGRAHDTLANQARANGIVATASFRMRVRSSPDFLKTMGAEGAGSAGGFYRLWLLRATGQQTREQHCECKLN